MLLLLMCVRDYYYLSLSLSVYRRLVGSVMDSILCTAYVAFRICDAAPLADTVFFPFFVADLCIATACPKRQLTVYCAYCLSMLLLLMCVSDCYSLSLSLSLSLCISQNGGVSYGQHTLYYVCCLSCPALKATYYSL